MIIIAVGNRRFKICVENHLHAYIKASCKKSKSLVVTRILDTIRASSQAEGGGFIRKDRLNKRYYEVKEKIAREKVGQALRDASVEFLKIKEEGKSDEDLRSIPVLAPESPQKGGLAPRDAPANGKLLETEAKFIPMPLTQSNQPGCSMQRSPRKRTYESCEMEPIVTPTSKKQVVCEKDLSVGPSWDLLDKQNRPQSMKTRTTSSSSMIDNFVKAASNLKQVWMPAWAPMDFEPTPFFESTALKNVYVSRQA
jgi:hypothetical protein